MISNHFHRLKNFAIRLSLLTLVLTVAPRALGATPPEPSNCSLCLSGLMESPFFTDKPSTNIMNPVSDADFHLAVQRLVEKDILIPVPGFSPYFTVRVLGVQGMLIEFQEFPGFQGEGTHSIGASAKILKIHLGRPGKVTTLISQINKSFSKVQQQLAFDTQLSDDFQRLKASHLWGAYNTNSVAQAYGLSNIFPPTRESVGGYRYETYFFWLKHFGFWSQQGEKKTVLILNTPYNAAYLESLTKLTHLPKDNPKRPEIQHSGSELFLGTGFSAWSQTEQFPHSGW